MSECRYSVVKQPGADARRRPGSRWRQGSPLISSSVPPKGSVRNAWQKAAFATAREPGGQPPHRWKRQRHSGSGPALTRDDVQAEPGPRKQLFTCVPHTDGFVGLLDVPGLRASAPAPRSCELSPGHALEPSARVTGVCHIRPLGQPGPRDISGPATSADLRAPFHAAKTTAARSVSVRDGGDDTSPSVDVKNKIGTSTTICSDNQKYSPVSSTAGGDGHKALSCLQLISLKEVPQIACRNLGAMVQTPVA